MASTNAELGTSFSCGLLLVATASLPSLPEMLCTWVSPTTLLATLDDATRADGGGVPLAGTAAAVALSDGAVCPLDATACAADCTSAAAPLPMPR